MFKTLEGSYCGFIPFNGEEFLIRITSDSPRQLYCCSRLRGLLLKEDKHIIDSRLSDPTRTGIQIVQDVVEVLERKTKKHYSEAENCPDLRYFEKILLEIEAIGWDRVVSLSEDMRRITIRAVDSETRPHDLTLNLDGNPDFHKSRIELDANLPEPFSMHKISLSSEPVLSQIFKSFITKLKDYQNLWNVLDEVDDRCKVLDPPRCDRSKLYRRIALSEQISMQINLAVDSPTSMCEATFFGKKEMIAPFYDFYYKGPTLWNNNASLVDNLEKILDVQFERQPVSLNTASQTVECGVCCSFELTKQYDTSNENISAQSNTPNKRRRLNKVDGKEVSFPDCYCDNPNCSKAYHAICLEAWLSAVPSTKHTTDSLHGTCLYCDSSINVQRQ